VSEPSPPLSQAERWLIEQWTAGFCQAIASMMGDAPKAIPGTESTESPEGADVFWWGQPLSGSPDAMFWVGAPALAWRAIGNEVLKSAGIDDGDDANIKSTYLEILGQSLSTLARALSARLRREVVCADGSEAAPVPASSLAIQMDLNGSPLTLFVAHNQALLELCETTAHAVPKALVQAPKLGESSRAAAETKTYPKGLDLLLDVELPVSVSFGRAELPIKDVIKLTSGSIVELNRSIAEPVEVIVNNVVIARGEVVVVEGNFGVRIKQVISRQERLRTLR
jgi:flagellar motor switch protein FliN/FliY